MVARGTLRKSAIAWAGLLIAFSTFGAAQERGQTVRSHDPAHPNNAIVGSWLETVTVTGGPTFKSLVTYHDDGTRVSSDQGSVITEPPFPHVFSAAHGLWAHERGRTAAATFVQLISGLAGELVYVNNVRQTITLGKSRDTYRSAWTAEFVDAGGNVVVTFEGTAEGRRIKAERLP